MKNLSLILRIVAIIAAVGAAALFFMAQGKLKEKQTALEKTQAAHTATQAELETANEQVASLEARIATERESLADTKRKLENIRSEMYTAKQEVTRTQQQLRTVKTQAEELEDTTRRLRSDLVKTEQNLASASKVSELAQLNERIGELEKANAELEQSLSAARSASRASQPSGQHTESSRTPVTAASYSQSQAASAGPSVQPASIGAETTIASISTNDGILILNNTPELGLAPGAEITLIQDLKALGKVRVNKISGSYAITNILPGAKFRGLNIGDSVNLLR